MEGLSEDLRAQREFLEARVPVYARLLEALPRVIQGAVAGRLERAWADREFFTFYDRPLLLLAALRFDALSEGASHPLYPALVPDPPQPGAVSEAALSAAMAQSRDRFWEAAARRTVQTNEASRGVAWLWPAHLLARAGRVPELALVDLGASAGLNLVADALPSRWIAQAGAPLALEPRPGIALRLGLDLAPLDVRDPASAQWLRACIWPGETSRLERLESMIEQFRLQASRPDGPRLEVCDLTSAADRLRRLPPQLPALAFQTIVRDYLSPAARDSYERSMRDWLRQSVPAHALWVELELADPEAPPDRVAALTVHLFDGHALHELVLARTHPHPHRLFVDEAAVDKLVALASR
ncbi:MAG: DUF2332 family protein [Myxococcaceae bacterium]